MSPHPDLKADGTKGYLAVGQATIRFCQEPETFPIFLAWCRKSYDGVEADEWFRPDLVMDDLAAMHNLLPQLEQIAKAFGMLPR